MEHFTLAWINWQAFEFLRKILSHSSPRLHTISIRIGEERTFNLKSKVLHVMSSPVTVPFDRWGQTQSSGGDSKLWIQMKQTNSTSTHWSRSDRGNCSSDSQIWITAFNKKSHIPELWLQCSFVARSGELHSGGTISVSNFAIDLKSIRFRRAHAGCGDKSERQSERCSLESDTRQRTNYRTRYCQTRFTAKPHGHRKQFSGKQLQKKLFRMSFRRNELKFRSFSTKRTSITFFNGRSVFQLEYAWIAGKEQQESTLRTANSLNNSLMVIVRWFRFPDTPQLTQPQGSVGWDHENYESWTWLIVVWLMKQSRQPSK